MPPGRVSAVVPVFSVIIAVIIVIALVWSYFYTQRRTRIETADFEFYSPMNSIRSRFSSNELGCVYHKIKDLVQHMVHRRQSHCQEGVELQLLSDRYGTNRYGTVGLLQPNSAHWQNFICPCGNNVRCRHVWQSVTKAVKTLRKNSGICSWILKRVQYFEFRVVKYRICIALFQFIYYTVPRAFAQLFRDNRHLWK